MRIRYAVSSGVREMGRAEAVDAHTLFAIGSTTKAMTAAAVGMLVDDGKLSWHDPVIDHLPWFRLSDPYATRQVTVPDLLTHRAGLGNADLLWYGQPDRSPREIVEALRHLEPAHPCAPGSRCGGRERRRGREQGLRPWFELKRIDYDLRLLDRRRDRVRCVLHRLFVPNPKDWAVIELPRWLAPAYYVLCPVRLPSASLSRRAEER